MGSVDYWRKRLNVNGIETNEGERFGDSLIQFEDTHGLSLELIENPTVHSTLIQSSNPKSAAHRIESISNRYTFMSRAAFSLKLQPIRRVLP